MSQASQRITTDLTLGAVAGTLATFALSGVSQLLYANEWRTVRWRENWARGGKQATRVAAERLTQAAGLRPSEGQLAATEGAIHFGIGAGSGAAYGAIRPHVPAPAVARGIGFGVALWAIADEGLNPALGLTPGPTAFPWQAHARGLASHVAFGLATEALLTIADRLRGHQTGS